MNIKQKKEITWVWSSWDSSNDTLGAVSNSGLPTSSSFLSSPIFSWSFLVCSSTVSLINSWVLSSFSVISSLVDVISSTDWTNSFSFVFSWTSSIGSLISLLSSFSLLERLISLPLAVFSTMLSKGADSFSCDALVSFASPWVSVRKIYHWIYS